MEFSFSIPRQDEILGQFANKWYDFVNQFHSHQDQTGLTKTSFLLHFGAQTIKQFQVSNKISMEEIPRFSSFLETLELHCLFQIVLCFIRHLFFTHHRHAESTLENFYSELKLLSDFCSFDESTSENIIKNQVICNIVDKSSRDVLISVNTLTAKNVVDVCSLAEKRDGVVNIDMLNRYMMNLQQKSVFNSDHKMKKNYGWSSFQETQAEITRGLNLSTPFRMETPCLNETRKAALGVGDFQGKQTAYSNFNYPMLDPVSDPSFMTNPIHSGMGNYHQNLCAGTTFPQQFPHSTNFQVPFSNQPQSQDNPGQIKNVENEIPCLTTEDSSDKNMLTSSDRSMNDNNPSETKEENHDDLLMCIIDPNSDSKEEEKDQTPSVSYVPSKGDVSEAIPVYISQQKAVLKTSQIVEADGQAVDVYSCNFCIFSCAGKSAIEEHCRQVHKSLKCFVCTACNAKFSTKEELESHVRVKHLNVEEHKCQICDMVLPSQGKLFIHLQGHAEPTTVSCRVCFAMFPSKKHLSEHMAGNHPNTDKWICRVCGDTFALRRLLSDHVSEVHKEREAEKIVRKFLCRVCDITFTDKKSSEMHKKKFHRKIRLKRFPCNQCDHVCSSNANLISHKRIHTGEKPYMCEVCGKEFSQSSSLDKHVRIHTGEKPFKCQYCDQSFNTSSNRLMHERNHRNERPYLCEQCSKTFRNAYELKVHIETHNEFRTKRFNCHCGAAFDTRKKLKRHEMSHTGTKPYKCEFCGSSFTRSENLKGHQKSQACRNRVLKLQ